MSKRESGPVAMILSSDDPICTHPRTGRVTSHPRRGPGPGLHASVAVCSSAVCIADAQAWVARKTGMPGIHVFDDAGAAMREHMDVPWRVGRKLGRTLYAVDEGNDNRDCDFFLGILDDPVVAVYICEVHNADLAARRGAR